MHRHQRGAQPARRARTPEHPGWKPQDDVAAVKGCLASLGILGVAAGLGVLVTLLLLRWA